MSIQFLCPHCNQQIRTSEEYAGKLTRCKGCGQTMRIPGLESYQPGAEPAAEGSEEPVESFPEAPEETPFIVTTKSKSGPMPAMKGPAKLDFGAPAVPAESAPASESGFQIDLGRPAAAKGTKPAAKAPAKIEIGAPAAAPAAASTDSAEPAGGGLPQIQVGAPTPQGATGAAGASGIRPSAAGSGGAAPAKPVAAPSKGPSTYFNLNKGTIAFILIGLLLLGMGAYEAMEVGEASSTPTEMSISQLVAKRSVSNRHIKVNGVSPYTDGKMYEGTDGSWTRVWIPFIDANDPELDKGGTPRALMVLRSKFVPNKSELQKRQARTVFQGIAVEGSSLSTAERSMINKKWPELRNVHFWLLDEGVQPRSSTLMMLYFVGGLAVGGLGVFLMFFYPPIEGM